MRDNRDKENERERDKDRDRDRDRDRKDKKRKSRFNDPDDTVPRSLAIAPPTLQMSQPPVASGFAGKKYLFRTTSMGNKRQNIRSLGC